MLYKILDKYSKLKANNQASFIKGNKEIEQFDKEIIKNFLNLYDRDVKQIHHNEEIIEKKLSALYVESTNLEKNSKLALKIYNNLVEYFKEAGDLYNWCGILEKEMEDLEDIISGKNKDNNKESNDKNQENNNEKNEKQ